MRDRDKQRRFQRESNARRRQAWLAEHGPCARCGSIQNLEVDHIDPLSKVSHNVWSWSEARRCEELAKCQVLCRRCHQAKTAADNGHRNPRHGTATAYDRGCRCADCRESQRVRIADWRARKRAAA